MNTNKKAKEEKREERKERGSESGVEQIVEKAGEKGDASIEKAEDYNSNQADVVGVKARILMTEARARRAPRVERTL